MKYGTINLYSKEVVLMKFKNLCIFTMLMFVGAFRVDALSFSVSGSSQVPTNVDGEFAINIKTDDVKPEKINLILG